MYNISMIMAEIKEEIIKFQDTAKIQKFGQNSNGKNRYMIYITGICKEGNLSEGDILVVSAYKIGHKDPKCNFKKANIKIPQETEEFVEKKLKIEEKKDELKRLVDET